MTGEALLAKDGLNVFREGNWLLRANGLERARRGTRSHPTAQKTRGGAPAGGLDNGPAETMITSPHPPTTNVTKACLITQPSLCRKPGQ